MIEIIQKLHHISAIVGAPNQVLKFYRDILGLRLVKKTLNYDDLTHTIYTSVTMKLTPGPSLPSSRGKMTALVNWVTVKWRPLLLLFQLAV